jgi:MFS family permease
MDRRIVLVGVATVALATDLAFILLAPEARMVNFWLASLFGAAIYAMYPVLIAHANDHVTDGNFIQTSGGLLMLYGFGAIIGPLMAGFAMSEYGATGLFVVTAGAHLAIIGFALVRILSRAAVSERDKVDYVPTPGGRMATPETAVLAHGENATEAPIKAHDEND